MKRVHYTIDARYPNIGVSKGLSENLIDSIVFFNPKNTQNVKGAATDRTNTNSLDEVKIIELVKPSVVNILHLYCDKISVASASGIVYLKPEYHFCDGAEGSGFVVSKDGFVATNGHVAKTYPEEALIYGVSSPSLQPFWIDLIKEIIFQDKGKVITDLEAKDSLAEFLSKPNAIDELFTLVYALLKKNILSLSEEGDKYFIRFGNEAINFDQEKIKAGDIFNSVISSSTILESKLVDFDYPNRYSVDVILNKNTTPGSDVAILKANSPGLVFPSLPLGSSKNLKEGAPLLVVGFPGLVQGSQESSSLVDYNKSSTKPTITKGITSAIKTDTSGKTLIQTDASIDHGNSGGPAFNYQGEVIGIATYGFESKSGNYNFLRDVDDLKALMQKNSISQSTSDSYNDWKNGLNNFWSQYYKKSLNSFDKVKQEYSIHPTVDDFINDANTAITNGEDQEKTLIPNIAKEGSVSARTAGTFGLGLVPIILIITNIGAVIAFVIYRYNKKKEINRIITSLATAAPEIQQQPPSSPSAPPPVQPPPSIPPTTQVPVSGST